MKVTLAKNAGFCFGVKRAADFAESMTPVPPGKRVCIIGKLIHNRIYNRYLEERGIEFITPSQVTKIAEMSDLIPTDIIIRTHGITADEEAKLDSLAEVHPGLKIHDMTCPYVKRIHRIAEENTGENTFFILYGDPEHPESRGIMSHARGEKICISSLDEFNALTASNDFSGKVPVLCAQTTQNSQEFKKIKKNLQNLYTNCVFFDTICSVTENRQNEAIDLAGKSDLMIVIGGKDSSNTSKLYRLCSEHCPRCIWIESLTELTTDFPDRVKNAGITAGASTPDGIITEVFKAMEEKRSFEEMLEETLKTLHTGDTVNGTVFAISDTEIHLDLGTKVTGVIPKEQITDDTSANLNEMFKIGDEVRAFVIRVDDSKGVATLSKKRVDADNSWIALKEMYDAGTITEAKITAAVKGGLLASVDKNTVFIPASQSGKSRKENIADLVGTVQKIKLIDFDESKKRALGSIKAVLDIEKKAKEEAFWSTIEVGKHYTGIVKNLAPYGAFVDIGGVDGMIHNTELSWKRIKHPSQVVSVGQEVDVFVKDFDPETKRISLGYKTQEMDTWYQFIKDHKVGDVVTAKIASIMPFGAFATVYDGVDGLIHISRISTQRINKPEDVLSVGQEVRVKITEIDEENRKLALSMRAVIEDEERAAEKARKEEEDAAEAARIAEERAEMAPYIAGSID